MNVDDSTPDGGREWEVLIYFPADAPESEREAFLEAVADAVHNFEPRSGWDPQMVGPTHLDRAWGGWVQSIARRYGKELA